MIKEWFNWINLSIAAVSILLILAALLLQMGRYGVEPALDPLVVKNTQPAPAFLQPQQAYDSIPDTLLRLETAPVAMQLPDLHLLLSYYGKNGRPDVELENALMYFAFQGDKTFQAVIPGERVYLAYDRKSSPPRYIFSPNNSETHLWIEAALQGNQAFINVRMKAEDGQIVKEPAAYSKFVLSEKPFSQVLGVSSWEIGKNRVDATLLARQRARWLGVDRFLEEHGGPEFEFAIGKQRVDFTQEEAPYSVFIAKDSTLIWTGERWKVAIPGDETLGRPLLVVNKVDERLMNLEIWDPEGKGKVNLNLLKSSESPIPPNFMASFKFLGAKTLSQFLFEINQERIVLSPQDWLLNEGKGWKKLTTPEEIDDYVERRTVGYLLVLNAFEKRDDRQILVGTLYNRARSDSQPIELVMQQVPTGLGAPAESGSDEESAAQSEEKKEQDELMGRRKSKRPSKEPPEL